MATPRIRLVLSLAILAATAAVAAAQKPPLGPPEQANTFEVGNQGDRMSCLYYGRRENDVASDADGNFVVVWSGQYEGGSPYYEGVFAQRFDRFGFRKGPEFRVNGVKPSYAARTPSIGMADDGGFVVVWQSYRYGDEYLGEIEGRRFNAAGQPLGGDFRVSDHSVVLSYPGYSYTVFRYGALRNPDVAMEPGGEFFVVWQREGDDEDELGEPDPLGDEDETQIAARRFSASATAQGPAFKVSDGSDGGSESYFNSMPAASFEGGDLVVGWKAIDAIEGGEAILGRRFDALGAPTGGEFRVSPVLPYSIFETTPAIEHRAAGGFIVTWSSSAAEPVNHGDAQEIVARVYDAGGTPGGPFVVNETNAYSECGPQIVRLADASFVVGWHHGYGGDGDYEAFGRLLDAGGSLDGSEFILDGPPVEHSAVALAAQGNDFVASWSGAGPATDGYEVFVRRFGANAAPSCGPAPLGGCRQPTRTGAGVLRWKRDDARPSRNRLTWSWAKGDATSSGDLGDPIADTSYALCVYDSSGGAQPLATMAAPGGTKCGLFPCWLELSGQGPPLMYLDNAAEVHGLTQVRIKPGTAGKAKISAKGRGGNLPLPATPLVPPVTVQLQATNGECWAATYDALVKKNANGQFLAKPTAP